MGAYTYSADLLSAVKAYLQITWSDEATDQRIGGLMLQGMQYLDQRSGAALDYESTSSAQTLLMEYVRYARDNALEVFENNFLHLIISLREEARVNALSETEPSDL